VPGSCRPPPPDHPRPSFPTTAFPLEMDEHGPSPRSLMRHGRTGGVAVEERETRWGRRGPAEPTGRQSNGSASPIRSHQSSRSTPLFQTSQSPALAVLCGSWTILFASQTRRRAEALGLRWGVSQLRTARALTPRNAASIGRDHRSVERNRRSISRHSSAEGADRRAINSHSLPGRVQIENSPATMLIAYGGTAYRPA